MRRAAGPKAAKPLRRKAAPASGGGGLDRKERAVLEFLRGKPLKSGALKSLALKRLKMSARQTDRLIAKLKAQGKIEGGGKGAKAELRAARPRP